MNNTYTVSVSSLSSIGSHEYIDNNEIFTIPSEVTFDLNQIVYSVYVIKVYADYGNGFTDIYDSNLKVTNFSINLTDNSSQPSHSPMRNPFKTVYSTLSADYVICPVTFKFLHAPLVYSYITVNLKFMTPSLYETIGGIHILETQYMKNKNDELFLTLEGDSNKLVINGSLKI